MTYIMVHGGNKRTVNLCKRSGWQYGAQHGYTIYDKPYMLDYTGADWQDYMSQLKIHKPTLAVCADFRANNEWQDVNSKIMDVAALGITPIVVAKHLNSLRLIPESAFGIDVRIGVSVPVASGYMDDGFMPTIDEFNRHSYDRRAIHLLGGHPDQWLFLRQYYSGVADVASADGNVLYSSAREYGKFWSRYGGYCDLRGKNRSTAAMSILSMRNVPRYIARNHYTISTRIQKCKMQLGLIPKQLKMAI